MSVGLTLSVTGVATFALWTETAYLRPYWQLVADQHGWYLATYGAIAVTTVAGGVYVAARAVSLGAVGRKVGVVERTIRRGAGEEPELAAALAREEAGDYR